MRSRLSVRFLVRSLVQGKTEVAIEKLAIFSFFRPKIFPTVDFLKVPLVKISAYSGENFFISQCQFSLCQLPTFVKGFGILLIA